MPNEGIAAVAGVFFALCLILPAVAQAPNQASAQPSSSEDALEQQARQGGGRTGREAQKESREAQRAATQFAEAATTYVEVINLCLTNRSGAAREVLRSARGELTRLGPMLNDETQKALDGRQHEMETAQASGDLTATSLAAAESFKTIITSMNPQLRRTPVEVSLHTYWAFRLVTLASAPDKVDWPAITQSAKESEKSWITLRRMVRDTNLRVLLSEIQSGLRDAVARNDAAGVKFAARLQIGSTAVLRDFFERFARSMARGR